MSIFLVSRSLVKIATTNIIKLIKIRICANTHKNTESSDIILTSSPGKYKHEYSYHTHNKECEYLR